MKIRKVIFAVLKKFVAGLGGVMKAAIHVSGLTFTDPVPRRLIPSDPPAPARDPYRDVDDPERLLQLHARRIELRAELARTNREIKDACLRLRVGGNPRFAEVADLDDEPEELGAN